MTTDAPETPAPPPSDFIRDVVAADVASGKVQRVITRFPPEPNGYLHIGHAKSICLNFGIAREFGGVCNLRMDDTNPTKEELEYVESIVADVQWLIGGWADHVLRFKRLGDTSGKAAPADETITEPFYASDYFQQLHDYAVALIKAGKAYVCDLTPEQVDAYRGAPGEPGKPSPWRDRSVEENLDLFARMKAGEFPDAARSLRAKIDMAHPNVWLRDPLLYRIRHASHHHTGDAWCIYPLYDYAHCLSDSIEGVTHSVCTLEFEVHRPLYDWIVDNLPVPQPRPHQYEFAKLMPTHVVISKRKLLAFVNEGVVSGWDDPRMPTLSGLRRRGVTPEAIRDFVTGVGVTKFISHTDYAVFEHAVRSDLNARALRRLAVLQPIKVVITNYPEGQTEELPATNNPTVPESGTRPVPFSRELWIEQDDFAEVPPPKFFRLKPGGEVRLKYAYIIKCEEVVKDADGKIVELRCTADLDSKSGGATSSRKVKGTIHWVSAAHAVDAEVRLYDRLFHHAEPEADGRDWRTALNPHSLEVVTAKLEPSLKDATMHERYQFERLAYFALDSKDSEPGKLVFNRIITLKDTWAKEAQKA
ncbi:MAG: glutamine--tRNA ligase/YqeY domain fusion protein [Chthoniobacter sp.]|nr:glutamine--tRNA ligase/YqeY domain fusion protein [Chthoniobacter sp.]